MKAKWYKDEDNVSK